ncbi:MAG TPA: pitrilysin family protein [Longimicrobiales bacterium]|nr:pitrilysin family protein [Longimicrobiales bacterium]
MKRSTPHGYAIAVGLAIAAPLHAQEASTMELSVPYSAFTLDNGLRVLVHEDHSVPIAAVNVWYRVGSANELPGRTGFAHLFEHLMFEGSANVPEGEFDNLLESAGGINNGSTNSDRTNYWETVPANAVELALWLEADRMGGLLEAMTQEKLDAQRSVVQNERRQSYENRPYGLAWETVLAELYPPTHPYNWPTIGSMADLEAASMEDVRRFFRTYYAPNNAILAVAGDVTVAQVRELVERHFEHIARGPAVPPIDAPLVALDVDRRRVLEDEVTLPRLYMVWHSPAYFAPGDAEMDVIARVLADGKTSRLYRRLVYERQTAQEVSAFQSSGQLGSSFWVVVTARPGVDLDDMELAVREEVARLAAEGASAREVERSVNGIETGFVDALQTVGGFGGKADRLNFYEFYVGDPGFVQQDLARYSAITADDLRERVRRHLADEQAVVLSVVPRGEPGLAAGAEETPRRAEREAS